MVFLLVVFKGSYLLVVCRAESCVELLRVVYSAVAGGERRFLGFLNPVELSVAWSPLGFSFCRRVVFPFSSLLFLFLSILVCF